MSGKKENEYRFSYVGKDNFRLHRLIKAASMEEAHQKGKEQALFDDHTAHNFLTERSKYEE